jgi:hypothetical protein
MFSWFFKKDKVKELEAKYLRLLEEARDVQRSGDLRKYATKLEEAEAVGRELEAEKAKAAK